MTWIEEYRRGVGMSREAFAAAITRKLGGKGEQRLKVPANLIYILENHPHPVTHPKLINLIARACGATKQQRDQFLVKARQEYPYSQRTTDRVVPTPHPWRTYPAATTASAREGNRKYQRQRRAVVIVNQMGTVIARADSVQDAAEIMGLSDSSVSDRLNKKIKIEFSATNKVTCRYADAWDAMTPEQQQKEMREVAQRSGIGVKRFKGVVVIDAQGNERGRYETVSEAASAEYVAGETVRYRCSRKTPNDFWAGAETTYRYADEWDKMTRAEQLRDIGAAL